MRRTARIAAVVMALLVLLPTVMGAANAAATLKYVGLWNGRFHYKPGSEYSKTDLFPGLKDVMPGDKITDSIEVYNNHPGGKDVGVYLRSLGAQEGTGDFLSQMNLTVQKRGGQKYFAAPANSAGQMKGWTHIATLKAGAKVVLDLTLNVPIEMGNEFQNQIGYIDWEFRMIEDPPDGSEGGEGSTVPETGDRNNLMFYGGLVLLSVMALIFLIFGKKRKKEEE